MIKSKTFGRFNYITKGKRCYKPFTISEYIGSWSDSHDFNAIYQFSYDQSKNEYISDFF